MTRRGWALFTAMCVIWGIPYLLIRVAVRDIPPGTLVFLRTAIGGLVLLPIALSRGGFGPVLRRWRPLVAFTVIEMAIPWLFLSEAEQHLSSSLSGLLIAAVPLVGVVVAYVVRADERADRRAQPKRCRDDGVRESSPFRGHMAADDFRPRGKHDAFAKPEEEAQDQKRSKAADEAHEKRADRP